MNYISTLWHASLHSLVALCNVDSCLLGGPLVSRSRISAFSSIDSALLPWHRHGMKSIAFV